VNPACNFDGCTVGETGICALEHDPATCNQRVNVSGVDSVEGADLSLRAVHGETIGSPVLERPTGTASFPPSHTLGPDAVSRLMATRYVTVVGILGDPDSGKTACLASTYLLIANAMLKGWSFADSKSLMGFEDIARGAREWNEGSPPSQMTMHTEMTDDRRAGFLHLRLVRQSDGRRVDLALPDLPGEWTTKLVTSSQSDRFEFMKAAEVIWIILDGRVLADRERRQGLISRVGQLGGRLKAMLGNHLPRTFIVITHRDAGEIAESVSTRLVSELQRKGVEATVLQVAPFSDNDDLKAGFGIPELIDASVGLKRLIPEFWPRTAPGPSSRSFIGYRRDQ
jgi:hypothetical protein